VIAAFEEYSTLALLGCQPKGQALLASGIDAIRVKGKGCGRTIFFDPAASHARIRKRLEAMAPRE
jgi:hypothetical protein